MKRTTLPTLITLLLSLAAGSLQLKAVPAITDPIKVTQPDGSVITLYMVGDENGFRTFDESGCPVALNKAGFYEPATPQSPAHFIRSPRHNLSASTTPYIRISNYPTLGHQKALVVLVEFADCKFTTVENAYDYYDRMLNEPGFTHANGADGSARDFYIDSSRGLFDPEFVVVGPVQLSGTTEFYGDDTDNKLDPNAWSMVVEACEAIDADINFADFDADGDGNVDSIYFFYAGFGEADSSRREAIWPHNGLLLDNWGVDLVLDGKRINNYACSNEIRFNTAPLWQPVGIGTFVHEFGHVLGLADHYDTLYSSGRSGVEQWDTMAAASYLNNQNTPLSFSAYERAVLGWLTPDETAPRQPGILSVAPLTAGGSALRIEVPDTEGRECFFVESRRREGWDRFLPAEGLIVWHIDEDETLWETNRINTDATHQHIDIVEADGTENTSTMYGDVFPGTAKVTTFSFKSWNGEEVFAFDYIDPLEERTLLILGDTEFIPAAPALNIGSIHGSSFVLSWSAQEDALGYALTVTDAEDRPLTDYENLTFNDAATLTIGNLTPNTSYSVRLQAVAGSYTSATVPVTVTTGALEFFESRPTGVIISDLRGDGFTASWQPLENATGYLCTLSTIQAGEAETINYDFTDGLDNLPGGWSTTSSTLSQPLFGTASPALRMSDDGDTFKIHYTDVGIERLTFFSRSQITDNTLTVTAIYPDGTTAETAVTEVSVKGAVETIDFGNEVTGVILTFNRNGGYIVIDDITLTFHSYEAVPVAGFENLPSADTLITVGGISIPGDYLFTVRGIRGAEISQSSEAVSTGFLSGESSVDVIDQTPTA
ncbi:MAG: M6 family metalloprotease domain-containing protein, partial [Muribaculaceae bacterium]|nr:M6 family metalloprotease domain-containing protein [Muribaculaceae bacterium]